MKRIKFPGVYDWANTPYVICPKGEKVFSKWGSSEITCDINDGSLVIFNEYSFYHSYFRMKKDVFFCFDCQSQNSGYCPLQAVLVTENSVEMGGGEEEEEGEKDTKFHLKWSKYVVVRKSSSVIVLKNLESYEEYPAAIDQNGNIVNILNYKTTVLNPGCFLIEPENSDCWRVFVLDSETEKYCCFLSNKNSWWKNIRILFDGNFGSRKCNFGMIPESEDESKKNMIAFEKRIVDEKWFDCEPVSDFQNLKLSCAFPIDVGEVMRKNEYFTFLFTSDVHIGSTELDWGFWKDTRTDNNDVFELISSNLEESDVCMVYGGDFVHSCRGKGKDRWENFVKMFQNSSLCIKTSSGSDTEVKPRIPNFFCVGNHDVDHGREYYKKYIGSSLGHSSFVADGRDILLMIFFDSSQGRIGSIQYKKIEELLKYSRHEYIICVTHYSFVYDVEKKWAFLDHRDRNDFEKMMNTYGVDLVLSGHTHQYLSGFGYEHREHSKNATFHLTHGLFPRDLTGFRIFVGKDSLKIQYFTFQYGNEKKKVFQTILLDKKERKNEGELILNTK